MKFANGRKKIYSVFPITGMSGRLMRRKNGLLYRMSSVFLLCIKKGEFIWIPMSKSEKTFSPLLEGEFFIGSEKHGRFESIGTAVIGAAAGNGIIKDMLSVYENLDFIPKTEFRI